jgi:hypothetical protein
MEGRGIGGSEFEGNDRAMGLFVKDQRYDDRGDPPDDRPLFWEKREFAFETAQGQN